MGEVCRLCRGELGISYDPCPMTVKEATQDIDEWHECGGKPVEWIA